jgi:hypothetical protein
VVAVSALQPAPGGYPIKLVRDRTPAIINASGEPGALFYDADDLPTADDEQCWRWLGGFFRRDGRLRRRRIATGQRRTAA